MNSAIAARPLSASSLRRSLATRGFALALIAIGLAGCNVELYTGLDQKQANEIIATLFRQGIPAERIAVKGGTYTVNVDETRFAEAVNILTENGLPRQQFATMGDVFKKDSLVSSPVQERAQMIYALSQELARTISDIDGVLSARVHLVLPENDPLRQQLVPSSASVFIRHQANISLGELVPQVKLLIANGVSGLSYDKVSVVLVPVEAHEKPVVATEASIEAGYTSFLGLWMHKESVAQAAWLFYGLFSLVLILGAGLGIVLLNQRQRGIYTLQSAGRTK